MPIGISPPEFFKKFQVVVEKEAKSNLLRDSWRTWIDYTKLMRESILGEVAEQLQLFYYPRDSYTLDGIMYTELDTDNFAPGKTYARSISIALEHETIRAARLLK